METCPTCQRPFTALRRRCYFCTGRQRTGVTRPCVTCGTPVYAERNEVVRGEGLYCSTACKYATMRGRETRTGTTYIRKDGYRSVKVGVRQYKLEHRLKVRLNRPTRFDEFL